MYARRVVDPDDPRFKKGKRPPEDDGRGAKRRGHDAKAGPDRRGKGKGKGARPGHTPSSRPANTAPPRKKKPAADRTHDDARPQRGRKPGKKAGKRRR